MKDDTPLNPHQQLNLETGRINIKELLPHFARGSVICVQQDIDLVDVALQFKEDNQTQVERWLNTGQIARASDDDAKRWQNNLTEFWALVASPWVLVQEINKLSHTTD